MLKKIEEIKRLDEETFLEDVVIYFDHRDEDDALFEELMDIAGVDYKTSFEDIENCEVEFKEKSYKIPFTITRHDRYVAISSAAYLLQKEFDVWLLEETLEDDTHGLLLLDKNSSEELSRQGNKVFSEKLIRLELGFDYFHKIKVPYIENENHNLEFEKEAQEYGEVLNLYKEEMRQLFEQPPKPFIAKGIDFIKSYWFPLLLLAFSLRYFIRN